MKRSLEFNAYTVLSCLSRLTAQLARTEEAAKRVLLQSDMSARGGVAQQLLDTQRANQKLTSVNQDLDHKLSK